jgi:PAS domain S-box-containing protein
VNIAENLDVLCAQAQAALNAVEAGNSESMRAATAQLREILARIHEIGATHENLHHGLLHASPDAITVHLDTGEIIDANPAAERIFGYSREALMHVGLKGLNPTLAHDHMALWWQRIGDGGAEISDTHNQHADGSMIPVRVRSIAFQVGTRRFIAAIARDISDESARSRALAESDQRFNELFFAIDKGVMIHSAEQKLLAINPVARRILDIPNDWTPSWADPSLGTTEQTLERHIRIFDSNTNPVAPEDEPIARAAGLGEACESQVVGVLNVKTQKFSWLSISVTPQFRTQDLPGPQSPTRTKLLSARPFQVMTIFSDITELKRAAEFFEETQRLAGIGCWDADVQTGKVYWSDTLFHMLEMPPQTALALDAAFACVHPGDQARLLPWWDRMQIDPQPMQREIRLVTASNKTVWMRVSGKPKLLNGKLWRVLGTCQDITAVKIEQAELTRRAQMDAETGLMNRAAAMAQLQLKLEAHATPESRETQPNDLLPGLLLIDLDRLHLLETIVGELATDALLIAAVARLRANLPAYADLARFSDVEILVMIDVNSEAALWQHADRVSHAFSQPFASGGEEFLLNPAIGVARFPSDGNRLPLLLRHLDAATTEAKQRSGAGWQGFSAGLAMKLRQRLQLEAQLRKALEQNEFTLLYQPKVNLRTGALLGVEALLRWNNQILGELSPTVFIPYAESTGDIVPIGAWVLREACAQMRLWRAAGLDVGHVAVNVSFRQFLSERFTRDVSDALRNNHLPGECLELELTERVFVDDGFETQNTIADLRRLGVKIVIDDFGEGYSALGYLRRLNVHGIKISHHFMREIPHSDVDTKVCRAMIMMADSLGLSVVAEGVETPAQCDFLLSLGSEVAQGFMFSAPIQASVLAAFITSGERGRMNLE